MYSLARVGGFRLYQSKRTEIDSKEYSFIS